MKRPFEDPDRARELGRRGGHAKAAKLRAARGQVDPLGGTIVELAAMLGVFQEPTWARWWALVKAVFALPLSDLERAAFVDPAHRLGDQRRDREHADLGVLLGRHRVGGE